MNDGACRVSAIEERAHLVSPVVRIAVCDLRPDAFAIVNVFALAVFEFSDLAKTILLLHLDHRGEVAVVFAVSVDLAVLFNSLAELDCLLHIGAGKDLGENVKSALHATNGKGSVLVCKICKNDSVHIVIQEILEVFIKSAFIIAFFKHILHVFANVGVHIADRNDVCKLAVCDTPVDHRFSAIPTKNAYSDLIHDDSPPELINGICKEWEECPCCNLR